MKANPLLARCALAAACALGAAAQAPNPIARVVGSTPWMRIVRRLGMCALLGTALSAAAQSSLPAWADRDLIRARLERLTEPDLKLVFLRCCEESERGLLTFEAAVRCSLAYEVVKQRVFGGDFQALLHWWRLHRNGSSAADTAAGP